MTLSDQMIESPREVAHRFYEFWVPKHGVFKDEMHRWPNIAGYFIGDIVKNERDLVYWFVQEGLWFQVCFATNETVHLEQTIKRVQKHYHIKTKKIIRDSVADALNGDRWVQRRKLRNKNMSNRRSALIFLACHAACRLYLDTLERQGKNWVVEQNNSRQNRYGNIFESFMHLLANFSQAQFDVQLLVRTPWMHDHRKGDGKTYQKGYSQTSVICHV